MKIIEKLAARDRDPFNNGPVVIACLGDSVTHGCFEFVKNPDGSPDARYAPDEGYVAMLKREIDMLFPRAAVSVMNCGIGGDSTEGALKRFDRDVARVKPDLVTVDLGLNNAVNDDNAKAILSYTESLEGIFGKCRDIGAECVYITPNMLNTYVSALVPPPFDKFAELTAKAQNEGAFDELIEAGRKQAEKSGAAVADAYADWKRMFLSGVDTTRLLANCINHPVPFMHAVFAQRALEAMFS